MEMHEALEFCLRRLQAKPDRLLAWAAAAAQAADSCSAPADLPSNRACGGNDGANCAVLRTSQEVLAQTLSCLEQENS
ncbi:MAG TPA: hypothetical protein VNZ61_00030 [Roseomonas sp.]|nr:hypothetical protein [Roseomonas sp.]